MSFGAVAASVAGAAVGGMMSGGGGGGGEVNKAPWDPAIKPLQNSLSTGQALESYYQQNPFNPLQRVGYQNLFADLDNFRNVMAPQAMAFNNRMMNTNYQRKPAGAELGGAFTPISASQFLPPEMRMQQGGMGSSGGGEVLSTRPTQIDPSQYYSGLPSSGGGEVVSTKPTQIDPSQYYSGGAQGGGLSGVMAGLGGMPGLGGMGAASAQLGGAQGGGLAGVMNGLGGMQGLGSMGSAASMLAGQGGGEMGYNKPMQVTNAGLLSGGEPFGMSVLAPNSMSYGLLNWQELNPFTAANGIPKKPPVDPNAKTPEQIAMEEAAQRERDRLTNYGGD